MPTTETGTEITAVRQIALTVTDVGRATAFYRDAVGLRFLFSAGPNLAFLDGYPLRRPENGDTDARVALGACSGPAGKNTGSDPAAADELLVGIGIDIGDLVGLPNLLRQGHLGQQSLDTLLQREVDPQPWPPDVALSCRHLCRHLTTPGPRGGCARRSSWRP